MDYAAFNRFCRTFPAATYVQQWGGAHVWKVGGKLFAIGGWDDGTPAFTFKTSEAAYAILRNSEGFRPAPYLASRGMKWNQCHAGGTTAPETVCELIQQSYDLIVAALPKKTKLRLGLPPIPDPLKYKGPD